jgi:predicted porin
LEKLEMKKTLVALAALASVTAFAQSSVTLTGAVDVGIQSNDYKGNKISGINNNGSATSTIGFVVNEDLGGGLKAFASLNSDFNPVSTNANRGSASVLASAQNSSAGTFLNSQQRAGLTGGFGSIMMGVVNNASLDANGTGQPFGTAIGSGYGSVIKTQAGVLASTESVVRFDNSLRYDTPSVNGFTGTAYYAAKQTASSNVLTYSTTFGANDRAGVQEMALKYAQGPLNAIYVRQQIDYVGVTTPGAVNYTSVTSGFPTAVAGTALTPKVTLGTLAANYNVGAFTVGFTTQTNKDDLATTAVNTKANLLSAKYVVGPHMFGATTGALTNSVTAKKSTFTGAGYNYALSKTSRLYLQTETLADDGSTVAAVTGFTEVGTKRTRTGMGVVVGF